MEELSKHLRHVVLGSAVLPQWIADDPRDREVVRIHRSIQREKEPGPETVGGLKGWLVGGLRRIERTFLDAELAKLAERLGDTPEARMPPLDEATRSLVLPILELRHPIAMAKLSLLMADMRVAEADGDVRRTREQRDTAAATARWRAGQFRGLDNRP